MIDAMRIIIMILWWIVITPTLPLWILVLSVGLPFGWISWKEIIEFIWNKLYRMEFLEG